ncbi:uncharacterized protein BP5553_08119 [Venustampulla echinocandica]|uniref:RRM domain-containing protein n=1 Tax=Venustampulla echinocandica TaxID=2656787 RepID=A0A370TFU5_9HELO|nr:uncharacterized protein BP5553_08119 [Venustampulla echinocandica]RDL33751.1 hypothetical protein BP5553_08119 [Venustampulla echinocandica]
MPTPFPKPGVSRWIGTRAFRGQGNSHGVPPTALPDSYSRGAIDECVACTTMEARALLPQDLLAALDDDMVTRSLTPRNNIDSARYTNFCPFYALISEPAALAASESNMNVGISQQAGVAIREAEKGVLQEAAALMSSGSEKTKLNREVTTEDARGRHSTTGYLTGIINPRLETFRPSRMVLEKWGLVKVPRDPGSNYFGDHSSVSSIRQVLNLPDNENCALWVTYLPPDIDLATFLNKVRTGAVYAAVLLEPEGKNWTKAAKLVFKKHSAAVGFLKQVQSAPGIVVSGLRMKAIWNRIGYRENNTKRTRVLQLRGPPELMAPDFWNNYFQRCVVFELEALYDISGQRGGDKMLEFRFARVDGQAEALFCAIMSDPIFAGIVGVRYGPDPCDPESRLQ